MNKFFESISGCEIIKHVKENSEKEPRWVGILGNVAWFGLLFFCFDGIINKRDPMAQPLALIIPIACLVMMKVQGYVMKKYRSEKCIVRFTEEFSNEQLSEIKRKYRLKKDNKTGLWVVMPKK